MTDPAEFDPEATPAITLAGKAWPIPELAWLQLKKCRQELLELNRRVGAAVADSTGPADEGDEARAQRQMKVMAQVFVDLSNDDVDRLIMGPIHAALTALHPALKREEFDAWPTTESERQWAWLTVRRQSGLFVSRGAEGAVAESEPGEGSGAP